MDFLKFFGILRMYRDQNIGIYSLYRMLEVAFADVALTEMDFPEKREFLIQEIQGI